MDSVSRQRVGLVSARYLDNSEVGALELAILFVLCTHANRLAALPREKKSAHRNPCSCTEWRAD